MMDERLTRKERMPSTIRKEVRLERNTGKSCPDPVDLLRTETGGSSHSGMASAALPWPNTKNSQRALYCSS
jgi:hypothetical protein